MDWFTIISSFFAAAGIIAIFEFLFKSKVSKKATSAPSPKSASKTEFYEPRYFTKEELKVFNGVEDKKIYIAIKGTIFDVTSRGDFYGPDGGYHLFAGHDATRALAKMSFEPDTLANSAFKDLTFMEKEVLNDWLFKFQHVKNYPIVGRVLEKLDMDKAELEKWTGEDGGAMLVAFNGKVFDVTLHGSELYKAEGLAGKVVKGSDHEKVQWDMKDGFQKYPIVGNLV